MTPERYREMIRFLERRSDQLRQLVEHPAPQGFRRVRCQAHPGPLQRARGVRCRTCNGSGWVLERID